MPKPKTRKYPQFILDLMAEKTYVLSKAQAFTDLGIAEVTQALWSHAAAKEEHLSSLLDAQGLELEAAVHRISAASCYRKAGELGRAVNLFRAALAGPLRDHTRRDVEAMLTECLRDLTRSTNGPGKKRRPAKAAAG